jgi:hypothetical protein
MAKSTQRKQKKAKAAARRSTATNSIAEELIAAGDRSLMLERKDKKNYAERLSHALAVRFANELRATFPTILPDADGGGRESRARSSKGFKKLDVNYSTPELGLGLGVSIKTINFPDGASRRYTKNYTRVDGELRAEASDYHDRQPYAVMVAVIFLPIDSCEPSSSDGPSSFGSAVQLFRFRSGRRLPTEAAVLFEKVYIGLYMPDGDDCGMVQFFDVEHAPPKHGVPSSTLSFAQVIEGIVGAYDQRNSPKFEWADGTAEASIDLVSVDSAEEVDDE